MSPDDRAPASGDDAPGLWRFKHPMVAFGAAVDPLRPHKPFSQAPFGVYAAVLFGQIAREHYVLAVPNKLAIGYVGWRRAARRSRGPGPNGARCRNTPNACRAIAGWG